MRWTTSELLTALSSLPCAVKVIPREVEGETEKLFLTAKGSKERNNLFVYGLSSEEEVTDPSDDDIDHVVVTDGRSSAGGLTSNDAPTCEL